MAYKHNENAKCVCCKIIAKDMKPSLILAFNDHATIELLKPSFNHTAKKGLCICTNPS